jgi:hypothetical protein
MREAPALKGAGEGAGFWSGGFVGAGSGRMDSGRHGADVIALVPVVVKKTRVGGTLR